MKYSSRIASLSFLLSVNPAVKEAGNCLYISLSSALTEISIFINKALYTGKFEAMLFDYLSTILIYNKSQNVSKFVHNIINKVRSNKTTKIFTALEGDIKSQLLKEVEMYVDYIVHL